jgi:3-phenylpropionate/trans-cinnamate dioxygenase ferredoxin reductase subunit
MADRVMNRTVDPQISDYYLKLHQKNGVTFKFNTSLKEIVGASNPEKVICSDGTEVKADMVIIGAGIMPNVELAENAGLSCDNGIVVNEFCISSDKNIFSAGDCTLHPSVFYKRDVRLESVHNAIEQGKTAASSIMEDFIPYNQIPWFWSDQYDLKFQIAGLNNEYDEYVLRGKPEDNSFSVFYFKDGLMISSDCINAAPEHMMSRRFIFNKTEINREKLQDKEIPMKEVI